MNSYKIIAYNKVHKIVRKTIRSNSEKELNVMLQKENLVPVSIRKKNFTNFMGIDWETNSTRKASSTRNVSSTNNERTAETVSRLKRTKISRQRTEKELSVFTEQLAILLKSGMNLHNAVKTAVSTIPNGKLYYLFQSIILDLEKGKNFSSLLRKSNVFPQYYIEVVAVGEDENTQSAVFGELAQFLKTKHEYKERIISVLLYPMLIVTLLCIGIILFVFLFLPYYMRLMEELVSDDIYSLKNNILVLNILFYVLMGVAVASGGFLILSKYMPRIQVLLQRMILRTPVLGKAVRYYNLMWVCFLIKCLLEGGETLANAIGYSTKVVNNVPIRDALIKVSDLLRKGHKPAHALKATPLLPEIMWRWFVIGEEAMDKGQIFQKMYVYFRHRMNYLLDKATNLLQPLVTIIVGILIIIVIQLLIRPLFLVYSYI